VPKKAAGPASAVAGGRYRWPQQLTAESDDSLQIEAAAAGDSLQIHNS
jgi:hypothetical protein